MTEAMGISTTGQWKPCEACLQVKAKRYVVLQMTDKRANVKERRFFIDVGELIKRSSLCGGNYAVIVFYDCTRFKEVNFVKKKSDTTVVRLSLIAYYTPSQGLSIKCIRTDCGGESAGESQCKLDRRSITHKHTPPDTPLYNGVGE